MWTLSGFSDEISPDFEEQCAVAARLGLGHIELRSAWETNVLDLDDDRLRTVRRTLAEHDLRVSSIGSPIGKIFLDDDVDAHVERMRRAAHVADYLGAPFIRVFSFFMRPGVDPDTCRDGVVERLRTLVDVVAGSEIVLVHENEKDIFGDVPRRCLEMVRAVDSPNFALAWDPANFVQVGVRQLTPTVTAQQVVVGDDVVNAPLTGSAAAATVWALPLPQLAVLALALAVVAWRLHARRRHRRALERARAEGEARATLAAAGAAPA